MLTVDSCGRFTRRCAAELRRRRPGRRPGAAGHHLRRRRPGDHRRTRQRRPWRPGRRHHRDRCRQGPRRAGARRVRHPGRPPAHHPPQIVRLTGITTAMVHDAPTIAAVLPMFLEFARGAVLVATTPDSTPVSCAPPPNSAASVGRGPGAVHGPAGPPGAHPRGGPSVRLGGTGPTRGFGDAPEPAPRPRRRLRHRRRPARLIERVGNQGVHLQGTALYLPNAQRARNKGVADQRLPHSPGVYLFPGRGEVLYIGTATDLRRRWASTSTAPTRAAG